jgi:hypothetical protein
MKSRRVIPFIPGFILALSNSVTANLLRLRFFPIWEHQRTLLASHADVPTTELFGDDLINIVKSSKIVNDSIGGRGRNFLLWIFRNA